MNLLETILEQMSSDRYAQRQFLVVVLTSLMCLRNKVNFRNLSRYSDYHEKTYSRGFRRDFDFVKFNQLSLSQIRSSGHTLIAAVDCSFINKSGKHTYGLDKFYNGSQGKAEKGLEISTLKAMRINWPQKTLKPFVDKGWSMRTNSVKVVVIAKNSPYQELNNQTDEVNYARSCTLWEDRVNPRHHL